MRLGAVQSTSAALEGGGDVTGWPSLAELLKGDGEELVKKARKWLSMTKNPKAPAVVKDEIPTLQVKEAPPTPTPPSDTSWIKGYRYTELGNSKRLVYLCQGRLRWLEQENAWFIWSGWIR